MLIHDCPPPPRDDERAPIEPNWLLWRWVAVAAVIGFAAVHATGVVGYLLLCTAFAAACKAATEAVDYGGGLREWRQ
jgi:hypothetical protein